MAGPFSKANPPKRAGAYTNWVVQQSLSVDPPQDGIVALPFTHDWGPLKQVVEVDSFGEWLAVFGGSTTSPGYRAAYQAFKGEGVNGLGGASRLVCFRTGASAVKASKTIANTDTGTPTAITVVAKYEGARGNNLKVEVVANTANPSTTHDFVVYDGSIELERYSYAKTDIAALKTALAASNWITVPGSVLTGFTLALTAPTNLTSGADGSSLTSTEWTELMAALASRRFNVFVPFDLQDSSIMASLKTWVADPTTGLNAGGKRVAMVVGGTTASGTPDGMANALTRATAMNNENIVVFGGVTVQDSSIVDSSNVPVTLTASQLAPRIAGIIAARGEGASTTFARLSDVTLVTAPNDTEVQQSLVGGVMTLAQDSNQLAPVRVEKGITSYISDTTTKPKSIYGTLKFVLTMHGVEREITEFAENNVIGRLAVNTATREYLVAQMKTLLRARVEAGIIKSDDLVVKIDDNPPPADTDDFVALVYQFTFGRSVEQVRNTVIVG